MSPEQKEILFTTCCFFTVTSIENYPEIKNCTKVCLNVIGIEDPNFNPLFNSKIIDNEEVSDRDLYYEKLIYWLKCPKQYLNSINKINLLYRGSRDEFLKVLFMRNVIIREKHLLLLNQLKVIFLSVIQK